ncbi:MAG: bifunctional folylpolyglutamate synthase/dihydrofolate synthase [Candidatus Omnitrophica bacterium]|nr:bifunctional folylpolyglutamate synthase/dihydrofolate synthase [Candidatus Omnitrophota bacterium]
MIDKYRKAKDYLDSFLNYELVSHFPYQHVIKLERMYLLLQHLKIPYQNLRVIHIAGTKGKGSTAHFLVSLLAASGFKTGLFTSPHFFDFRERIKIVKNSKSKVQSNLISKSDFIKIVERFQSDLKNLKISQELGQVTFFEIITAVAFKYFIEERVDFVVLETGLGGRLDSTNVVNPLISIITHIGYDHTDKLGKKLSEIANEKAGIIKKNIPLVSSSQRTAALRVIKNKSRAANAPLFLLKRDFEIKNIRFKQEYTLFNFKFNDFILRDLKINLKGEHPVENASLALATLFLLERKGLINKKIEYSRGLRVLDLPGRFEVVSKSPLIVLDIAHNLSSFTVLGNSLKRYFPRRKIILIFACAQDKDAKKMIKKIDYSYLILTGFSSPRSRNPEEIRRIIKDKNVCLTKNIAEALREAKNKYQDKGVIVISGSLFLVSEAKKLL